MKGLGAVLIQDGIPVYSASRSLTPTEKKCQNLEHETLATIWGMEHFSHFLFSEEFGLETDQKPLVRIYKKMMDNISPRLTKLIYHSLVFRLVKVVCLKEKKNFYADALSRVSQMLVRKGEEDTDIIMVSELTSIVPIPVNDLDHFRAETAKHSVFMKNMECVMQGWPYSRCKFSKEVQPYLIHCMEIAVEDGILLKINGNIFPLWLRTSTISKIHEGHLGIKKSYLKARDAVFWPGMKQEITQLVECCGICQSNTQSQK